MAGDRTFTEGEAYALVADAVERETAAAKAEAATALEQVTTLSNEKDALELRATAAEEAKAAAEKALVDFKESIETEKAQEAKRSERVAALEEVAPSLKLEGERADRIVAMADEAFADYVASLREVAAAGPHKFGGSADKCSVCDKPASGHKDFDADDDKNGNDLPGKQKAGIPRESAAFKGGQPGAGSSTKTPVKGLFDARRAAMAPART